MNSTDQPSRESGRREWVKHHARGEFENWASSYDRSLLNELVFLPSIRACQEEIGRWQSAGRGSYSALDVGCGTGRLPVTLARDEHARLLVGVDFSRSMVRAFTDKIAAAQASGRRASARIHGVLADAERLPFADGSFDVLTCCNSFHHYPHQALVLAEFRRVLRPGGIAVLIDGFRDNVIGWLVFDVVVAGVERHVHHASWSEVRTMMVHAGFAEVRQRKLNVLAPLLVSVGAR